MSEEFRDFSEEEYKKATTENMDARDAFLMSVRDELGEILSRVHNLNIMEAFIISFSLNYIIGKKFLEKHDLFTDSMKANEFMKELKENAIMIKKEYENCNSSKSLGDELMDGLDEILNEFDNE